MPTRKKSKSKSTKKKSAPKRAGKARGTRKKKATAKKKSSAAKKRPGLWENIHQKRERIAHGSGEKMRKKGAKGAPSKKSFRKAEAAS